MQEYAVAHLAGDFRQRWDDFVDASPEGSVFSRAVWLANLAEAFGGDCRIAFCTVDGAIAAAVPLLVRRAWGIRYAPPMPITAYNGWLTGAAWSALPGTQKRACAEVLWKRAVRDIGFGWFSFAPGIAPPLPDSARWRPHERRTVLVPLDDFDRTWAGFSQSLRRKIRRAEETGIALRATEDAERIVALHAASYARHGASPPFPAPLLARWLKALFETRLIEGFEAVLPGAATASAVRVVARDGATVYDWLAGADVHEGIAASHWLVCSIMRRAAEAGARIFDFMGANTPGVTDFKMGFGGSVTPYTVLSYHRTAMHRTLERTRGAVVRRRRRLA